MSKQHQAVKRRSDYDNCRYSHVETEPLNEKEDHQKLLMNMMDQMKRKKVKKETVPTPPLLPLASHQSSRKRNCIALLKSLFDPGSHPEQQVGSVTDVIPALKEEPRNNSGYHSAVLSVDSDVVGNVTKAQKREEDQTKDDTVEVMSIPSSSSPLLDQMTQPIVTSQGQSQLEDDQLHQIPSFADLKEDMTPLMAQSSSPVLNNTIQILDGALSPHTTSDEKLYCDDDDKKENYIQVASDIITEQKYLDTTENDYGFDTTTCPNIPSEIQHDMHCAARLHGGGTLTPGEFTVGDLTRMIHKNSPYPSPFDGSVKRTRTGFHLRSNRPDNQIGDARVVCAEEVNKTTELLAQFAIDVHAVDELAGNDTTRGLEAFIDRTTLGRAFSETPVTDIGIVPTYDLKDITFQLNFYGPDLLERGIQGLVKPNGKKKTHNEEGGNDGYKEDENGQGRGKERHHCISGYINYSDVEIIKDILSERCAFGAGKCYYPLVFPEMDEIVGPVAFCSMIGECLVNMAGQSVNERVLYFDIIKNTILGNMTDDKHRIRNKYCIVCLLMHEASRERTGDDGRRGERFRLINTRTPESRTMGYVSYSSVNYSEPTLPIHDIYKDKPVDFISFADYQMVKVDEGIGKEIIKMPHTEFIQQYWSQKNKKNKSIKTESISGDCEMDGLVRNDEERRSQGGSYSSAVEGDDEDSINSTDSAPFFINTKYDSESDNVSDKDDEVQEFDLDDNQLAMLALELEKELECHIAANINHEQAGQGSHFYSDVKAGWSATDDSGCGSQSSNVPSGEDNDMAWLHQIFGESGKDLKTDDLPSLDDTYKANVEGTMPTMEELFADVFAPEEFDGSDKPNLKNYGDNNDQNMPVVSSSDNANISTSVDLGYDEECFDIFFNLL